MEALTDANAISDQLDKARLLDQIFRRIPNELAEDARAFAMACEGFRIHLVAAIASKLDREERERAIAQVFAEALSMQAPSGRAASLQALAPHLSQEQLARAFSVIEEIPDSKVRAGFLQAAAPHLSQEQLAKAISVIKQIPDSKIRGRALAVFAGYSSGQQRSEIVHGILGAAFEVEASAERGALLILALPFLTGASLFKTLSDVTECWFRGSRSTVLGQLKVVLPTLAEVGGPAIVQDTFVAIRDVSEWWP